MSVMERMLFEQSMPGACASGAGAETSMSVMERMLFEAEHARCVC